MLSHKDLQFQFVPRPDGEFLFQVGENPKEMSSHSIDYQKQKERFDKLGLPKVFKYTKPRPNPDDYKSFADIKETPFTSISKAIHEKQQTDEIGNFGIFEEPARKFFVLKRIQIKTREDKEWEDFKKELYLLRSLKTADQKRSFVVDCEGWFHLEDRQVVVIFEYVEGVEIFPGFHIPDLKRFIQYVKEQNGYIKEKSIWIALGQIISGLRFLDKHKIFHRDLKPSNILLTKNGDVKLSGFGLSRHCNNKRFYTYGFSFSHSLYYKAPEEFYKEYDHISASEVWSLGCILYELVELSSPFSYINDASFNLYRAISEVSYKKMSSAGLYTSQIIHLIECCLKKAISDRPTFFDLSKKATEMRNIAEIEEGELTVPQLEPVQSASSCPV